MAQKSLSITQARRDITGLPGRFANDPSPVEITKRGKPVMAVLPWDVYESMVETLDIMRDPELVAQIRKSLEQLAKGRTVSLESIKKEFSF